MAEKASSGINEKKKIVTELAEKMKKSKTILIASIKSLPSSQFQQIKKNLRGKAEIRIAKKSIVIRAIGQTEKGVLQNLKNEIGSDIAIFLSDLDAFELSSLLSDNQSPAKAKAGDIAPEDIKIDEGPTELIPGPAISELSNVGLKVAVEGGKLAIKQGRVVVKGGEEINEKVASVLGKLNILPMQVGFIPVVAYDAASDKIYSDIKIDKSGTLDLLKELIGKSFGFSVHIGYICQDTIKWFISKAGMEEKALEKVVASGDEEKKEEEAGEDKTEEKEEEVKENKEEGKTDEEKSEENPQTESNIKDGEDS